MDIYGFGLTFLVMAIIFILLAFAYLLDFEKLTRQNEALIRRVEKLEKDLVIFEKAMLLRDLLPRRQRADYRA